MTYKCHFSFKSFVSSLVRQFFIVLIGFFCNFLQNRASVLLAQIKQYINCSLIKQLSHRLASFSHRHIVNLRFDIFIIEQAFPVNHAHYEFIRTVLKTNLFHFFNAFIKVDYMLFLILLLGSYAVN